jgi:dihydroceramide fatty acyl 2-hydroxylase
MSIWRVLELAFAAGLGLFVWTVIEYTIHGPLSHRWKTFVSPLHWTHHRSPRNVFTSPLAAVPVAGLLFAISYAATGLLAAAVFVSAVLVGFIHYERVHWRIHFRLPRNSRERRLRSHHLAHHFENPRAYWGVTTRIWDRVFGTLPTTWPDDYAKFENAAPLVGDSNLRAVWNPRRVLAEVLDSRGT